MDPDFANQPVRCGQFYKLPGGFRVAFRLVEDDAGERLVPFWAPIEPRGKDAAEIMPAYQRLLADAMRSLRDERMPKREW